MKDELKKELAENYTKIDLWSYDVPDKPCYTDAESEALDDLSLCWDGEYAGTEENLTGPTGNYTRTYLDVDPTEVILEVDAELRASRDDDDDDEYWDWHITGGKYYIFPDGCPEELEDHPSLIHFDYGDAAILDVDELDFDEDDVEIK